MPRRGSLQEDRGASNAAAQKQLDQFLAKYTPEIEAIAREALRRLRLRIPGAAELVYDNYNALAIGFGSTERVSDVVLSIALYPRWVSLFFLQGATLPDPHGILKGNGNVVRHVVLETPADVDDPAIVELIETALERCRNAGGSEGEAAPRHQVRLGKTEAAPSSALAASRSDRSRLLVYAQRDVPNQVPMTSRSPDVLDGENVCP